jgi:hypothetical protein
MDPPVDTDKLIGDKLPIPKVQDATGGPDELYRRMVSLKPGELLSIERK